MSTRVSGGSPQSAAKKPWVYYSIFICCVCTLMVTSCGKSADVLASPVEYFPVQNQIFEVYATGAAGGILTLEDGCLRLKYKDDPPGVMTLPIWPYGFSFGVVEGRIVIYDEKGKLVAREGDFIYVGGAPIPFTLAQQYTTPSISTDVPGPYWLAGSSVQDDVLDLEISRKKLGLPEITETTGNEQP
jgi:hypothetical protein